MENPIPEGLKHIFVEKSTLGINQATALSERTFQLRAIAVSGGSGFI
jgi:hypothetical protein